MSGASSTDALKHSPEWVALADRRREIEQDPLLSAADRKLLIHDWSQMAQEVRSSLSPNASSLVPGFNSSVKLFALALFLIVLAIVFTHSIGAFHAGSFKPPAVLDPASLPQAAVSPVTKTHPGGGVDMSERVRTLQARLNETPDDLQGWALLARSQANLGDYLGSVQSLRKALALSAGHPDILADLADMIAMSQGRVLKGEPEQLIAQALQAEPRHEKALALAASAAEQAGNPGKAEVYWNLLSQVQQQKLVPAPSPALEAKPNQAPGAAFRLPIRVVLSSALQSEIGPKAVLFVYLKEQAGPGMPLAVMRVQADALQVSELQLTLDKASFIQAEALANLPPLLHVQARLALQGTVQPQSGDWASAWQSVNTQAATALTMLELRPQAR